MISEMNLVARHMAHAPFDLEALLADLGIRLESLPMGDGCSALIRTMCCYTIQVDTRQCDTRRRFAIAHELGHYLMHRDLMATVSPCRHVDDLFDGGGQSGDIVFAPAYQAQANRIAVQMLMPAKAILSHFANSRGTDDLAARFGVTPAAMAIRLDTLGLGG